MDLKLKELADHIGARLEGDPDVSIVAPAALDDAQPNQITFADDDRRLAQVRASRAGAIVVGEAFPPVPGRNLLRIDHPRLGFLLIMERFVAPPPPHVVHDSAVVSPAAVLGAEVGVGAGAVICADAHIGDRTQVGPGAVIGGGVRVGEDCVVGANATLLDGVRLGDRCIVHPGAVIGGEGFGFQWLGDHHHKVPQLGTVVIEDDVEIGCNTCIDRATLGETRIGRGSKIDNLVHVAHNNRIGRHVIITGQVGTAGSVTIGDGATLGGQVGISDHVSVGARARVGGKAAVTRDVAEGETVWGMPARAMQRVMRELAALGRLPETLRHIKALGRRVDELEAVLRAAPRGGRDE